MTCKVLVNIWGVLYYKKILNCWLSLNWELILFKFILCESHYLQYTSRTKSMSGFVGFDVAKTGDARIGFVGKLHVPLWYLD